MFNKKCLSQFILIVVLSLICSVQAYAFLANDQGQTKSNVSQVQTRQEHEIIVLVHGLMRSSLSMSFLKAYLERQGYQVYSYNYPSAKYSIQEHGAHFTQFIEELLIKNPGIKIHFVTHSLGGIIAREAIANLNQKQLKNLGCLIMLAPPNQGSNLAKLFTKIFPLFNYMIKPLAELSSDQKAYVHQVPIPNIKIGIIAGRYDAKVPPAATRLAGQKEPIVINATHTFIMNKAESKKLIVKFLKKGAFED